MTPTIGRIVLFQHWRRLEAAALVVGVTTSGALNLQVFHQDGSMAFVTSVPEWQADAAAIEKSRTAWADWDDHVDQCREEKRTVEGASPQTPQQSWRWPPRVDEATKTPATRPFNAGELETARELQPEGQGAGDVLGLNAAIGGGSGAGDTPAADTPAEGQLDNPGGSNP